MLRVAEPIPARTSLRHLGYPCTSTTSFSFFIAPPDIDHNDPGGERADRRLQVQPSSCASSRGFRAIRLALHRCNPLETHGAFLGIDSRRARTKIEVEESEGPSGKGMGQAVREMDRL